MKRLIFNLFALTIAVYITGCYTIIWDPVTEKFPTQENSYDTLDGYYPEYNFGDYAIFYDRPWWFDITPPAIANNDYNRDANPGLILIRNTGRGSANKINWPGSINNLPTRSSQPPAGNITKTNTSAATNSANTTNTTREKSNNVRNNDGSRNTEDRRKR